MAFKALFLAHAPDANKEKHRSIIDTGKYKLLSVVIKNQEEAIEECKNIYEKENIDAVLLCPGFKHQDVAEISQSLKNKVAVCVARGDGPGNRISQAALKRENYF